MNLVMHYVVRVSSFFEILITLFIPHPPRSPKKGHSMRTPVLMLLLFVLTACAAPSQTPPPQKIRDTATPEMAPTPTNIPPTATATMVIYDFSAFDPADQSTWPEEMRVAYENLSKRLTDADPSKKEIFEKENKVIHEDLMNGIVSFLSRQGVDMSEFQGEDVDILSVANSNKIAEAFGEWQTTHLESTGEMVKMPTDPWLIMEDMKTKLDGTGESTNKISVFGIKTLIKGIVTWGSNFTISAIMENPFNPNSAIIMAQSAEGTRPFLVIFEDTIIDKNQLVYYPGATKTEFIITIELLNDLENQLDLNNIKLTAKQIDGSSPIIDTESLTLIDVYRKLGTKVTGYQIDRANGIDALNGGVGFNALFDAKTGLEILGGISETDGTIIEPITKP